MVASIAVSADMSLVSIASLAGQQDSEKRFYREGALFVEGVSQTQLTAALAAYDPVATKIPMLISRNNMSYEIATKSLTADYPQLEKDTWPTQNEQAAAWVADPEGAVTPWIDLAARERGIDREEYLRRTLVKAEQFKILSAFLTGRRQRYEDEIKAGGDPVLDYALTPAVLAQLQKVAIDGMSLPAAELRGVL